MALLTAKLNEALRAYGRAEQAKKACLNNRVKLDLLLQKLSPAEAKEYAIRIGAAQLPNQSAYRSGVRL